MREQKRIRDEAKKAREQKITGGGALGADGKASISNAFIDQILRDEDPFAQPDDSANQSQILEKVKEECKISSYVVDMQIPAPVSPTLVLILCSRKKQSPMKDRYSVQSLIRA